MAPSAHADAAPTLTLARVTPARGVPVVVTATGALLELVELLPSWPEVPRPQQYAAPALLSPHAALPSWLTLTWVSVTPDSTPDVVTVTGVVLWLVEPLPS